MRWFTLSVLAICVSTTSWGHHPDRENRPVRQPIDLIGPLGTHLKMSHRRRYNRPTKIGGKIAYYIAPSSQEAMAWHEATHKGYYENHRPRIVTHYFYAKPWEMIKTGPRESVYQEDNAYGVNEPAEVNVSTDIDSMALPVDAPMANEVELIEQ